MSRFYIKKESIKFFFLSQRLICRCRRAITCLFGIKYDIFSDDNFSIDLNIYRPCTHSRYPALSRPKQRGYPQASGESILKSTVYSEFHIVNVLSAAESSSTAM